MIQLLRTMEQAPPSERKQPAALASIRPEDASRPLWYRVAGALEPLRPLFTWAVEHDKGIRNCALGLLGAAVAALVARRRFGQDRGK